MLRCLNIFPIQLLNVHAAAGYILSLLVQRELGKGSGKCFQAAMRNDGELFVEGVGLTL